MKCKLFNAFEYETVTALGSSDPKEVRHTRGTSWAMIKYADPVSAVLAATSLEESVIGTGDPDSVIHFSKSELRNGTVWPKFERELLDSA